MFPLFILLIFGTLFFIQGSQALAMKIRQKPRFATGRQSDGRLAGTSLKAPVWVGNILCEIAKIIGVPYNTPAEIQACRIIEAWDREDGAWGFDIRVGRTGWNCIMSDGARILDLEKIANSYAPEGSDIYSEVIARMGGKGTIARLIVGGDHLGYQKIDDRRLASSLRSFQR